MASFCGNCGAAQDASGSFCRHCGSPGGSRPSPPASAQGPVQPPQAVPSAGGNTALKIVVVLLCCLMLGGVAVVGGLFYVAHRVKQAVVQKAAENGVDLGGLTSGHAVRQTLPKPCDVLTAQEISQLIGEPIERTEMRDAMCLYYGPVGLSAKLAQSQASETFKRAQAPDAKTDGMEVANSVDQLVNNLGSQTAQITGQTNGGEQPLLMLGLEADGQAQMTALSASKAIFGGLGRSASDPNQKGLSFGVDIAGLGDKAIRMPKLGLNVLQAGVLIRIIPGPIPGADAKTIAIARAVLPKI